MKEYITKMDETYRSKQYPAGSVFEKAAGENRRGNITLAILSGAVSVLLAPLLLCRGRLEKRYAPQTRQ